MTLPRHLWRYALGAALAAGLVAGVLFTRQGRVEEGAFPP